MFTDTHCHLAAPPLIDTLAATIAAAQQFGVSGCLVPATQVSDWQSVLNLAQHDFVRQIAIGIHPWFALHHTDFTDKLADILSQNPHIWVGEIGLDALIDVPMESQLSVFKIQILLAQHFHRPIIVHNVRSTAAIVGAVKQAKFTHGGIVHAFSGSLEEAKLLINLGFKIGIGSLLLNPNAKKVHRAAAELPLSALLLETDSPYMLRNAVNTPANVAKIAQILANLRNLSLENLAAALERNLAELMIS